MRAPDFWYRDESLPAELLAPLGMVIEEHGADGNLPLGPLRRIVGSRLSEALDRAAVALAPNLFGFLLYLVLRRHPPG